MIKTNITVKRIQFNNEKNKSSVLSLSKNIYSI